MLWEGLAPPWCCLPALSQKGREAALFDFSRWCYQPFSPGRKPSTFPFPPNSPRLRSTPYSTSPSETGQRTAGPHIYYTAWELPQVLTAQESGSKMQQLTHRSQIQIQPRFPGHLQAFQLSWASLQTQHSSQMQTFPFFPFHWAELRASSPDFQQGRPPEDACIRGRNVAVHIPFSNGKIHCFPPQLIPSLPAVTWSQLNFIPLKPSQNTCGSFEVVLFLIKSFAEIKSY